MNLLAFDTATSATVVGLELDGGDVIERRVGVGADGRPAHTAQLLGLIDQVLVEAGLKYGQLDRVGVGVGPGSYTGVRVALATAYGLAEALDLELAGVETLAAVACGIEGDHPVVATTDARRSEIFAQAFVSGRAASEAVVGEAISVIAELSGGIAPVVTGEGASIYRELLLENAVEVVSEPECREALSGSSLCQLARIAQPASRDAILPLYLREPDAKPRS